MSLSAPDGLPAGEFNEVEAEALEKAAAPVCLLGTPGFVGKANPKWGGFTGLGGGRIWTRSWSKILQSPASGSVYHAQKIQKFSAKVSARGGLGFDALARDLR